MQTEWLKTTMVKTATDYAKQNGLVHIVDSLKYYKNRECVADTNFFVTRDEQNLGEMETEDEDENSYDPTVLYEEITTEESMVSHCATEAKIIVPPGAVQGGKKRNIGIQVEAENSEIKKIIENTNEFIATPVVGVKDGPDQPNTLQEVLNKHLRGLHSTLYTRFESQN